MVWHDKQLLKAVPSSGVQNNEFFQPVAEYSLFSSNVSAVRS